MFSTGHLIVVLVVILLLFGTKRLRNVGGDLGAAIKGFKKAMSDGEQDAQQGAQPPNPQAPPLQNQQPGNRVIDQAAQKQDEHK